MKEEKDSGGRDVAVVFDVQFSILLLAQFA